MQIKPSIESLLDPNSDLSEITEEMLVSLLEPVVKYQKDAGVIIGKALLVQEKLKDHSSVADFSRKLERGEKSFSSYKSVEKRLQGLTLPEDISYSARRLIAQQANPKETIKMIISHGLSSSDICRVLGGKEEKKEERKIECPRCHSIINLK